MIGDGKASGISAQLKSDGGQKFPRLLQPHETKKGVDTAISAFGITRDVGNKDR